MRPRACLLIATAAATVLAAHTAAQSSRAPVRATVQPSIIAGRVMADDAGTPVVKARVSVTPAVPGNPIALTDSDGLFSVAAGGARVTLTFGKAGYATTTIVADAGTRVDVRLPRGAAVEGRVVDEFGDPAVGVPVRLRSQSTPPIIRTAGTDDRGEYRIGGLPAGTYSVSPLGPPQNPADGFVNLADTQVVLAAGDVKNAGFTVPAGQSNNRVFTLPGSPPGATPVGTGVIRGLVGTTDGRPLAHATVTVFARRRDGSVNKTVLSDGNGRFAFAELPAGNAQVFAQKAGYSSPGPTAGRAVTVEDGRALDVQLLFDPIGAIEGQVVDEDGEPVEGVRVQALQVRYERGARRLVPASDYRETNDLGRYRLFGLVPGDYIVTAAAFDATSATLPGYGRSYYPGTPDATRAQFVTVSSSDAAAGINLSLPRVRTYHVSGRLLDSSGAPTTGGNVSLVPSVFSGQAAMVPVGARIGQDGTFEFASVMPGRYVVQADRGRRGTATEGEFGSLAVAVGDRDVTGLVLQTSAGSTVTGRIVLDSASGAKLPSLGGIDITPLPVDFDASPKQPAIADIREDGVFLMRGINGVRRLEVTRAPDGWTLEEVRAGGIDVTDRPLTFGRPEQSLSDVEIVLTDRVAHVAGSVLGDDGRAPQNTIVVLFPTARDRRYAGSRYMAAAAVSSDGVFSVSGLPAGSYYVAAVPRPRSSDPDGWQDPQMLESYTRLAQSIVVRDGETANVNLRVSSR